MYILGSSKCKVSGRSKTVTLALRGNVTASRGGSGNRVFKLEKEATTFRSKDCNLVLTGRWTERHKPDTGGQASFSHQVTLKVAGSGVSGTLVQDVVYTDLKGKVSKGRLLYEVEGKVDPEGQLNATLSAKPDAGALSWLSFQPTTIKGVLRGTIKDGKGSGEVVLTRFPITFHWKAQGK